MFVVMIMGARWVVVVVDGLWWRRDDVVGWSGNLSGTYWVVVIKPQLSRTATACMWDSGDRPVAVLYRPRYKNTLVCFINSRN